MPVVSLSRRRAIGASRGLAGYVYASACLLCILTAVLTTHLYVSRNSEPGNAHFEALAIGTRVASIRHQADFVEKVLAPKVERVDVISEEALAAILSRLRPRAGAPLSHMLHACHLFGPDATFLADDGNAVPILPLFFDSERAASHFRSMRLYARTRYGLRFPLVYPWLLGTDQSNSESHPGQGLATLAQLGISPLIPIQAGHSETFHVSDILNE